MARGDGENRGLAGCCAYIAILAFATAFLTIGFVYLHDCPLEPLIPVFLIVYGFTVLFLVAAEIMFWMCEAPVSVLVQVIRLIGILFCFAWLIAGSVWVLRTVRLPANATVGGKGCDPVVYNSAYAVVVLAFIVWGLSILTKLYYCSKG